MQVMKLIVAICFIVLGIILVGIVIGEGGEAYLALLGLLAIAWGIWDIRKVIIEHKKRGEIDDMEKQREDIKDRIESKEE
jgi:hypothetical protein